MRTTLTLDDDVAAELRRRQHASRRPWKQLVNEILRAGLADSAKAPRRRGPVPRTRGVRLGASRIGDIANVHEVLSLAEGDARK